MNTATLPVEIGDPINAKILAVSEDKIQGFQTDPFGEIARLSGVELPTVIERISAMLRAGTIRRVRQTLMATNLAAGALVAWQVPPEKLNAAFEYLFQNDPFSGHVVIRSTDTAVAGSRYRLWTTLKVPHGYSLSKHCDVLAAKIGAESYRIMSAKRLFALGVGHMRRRGMEPGSKADVPAEVLDTEIVQLSDVDWRVLNAIKREFTPDEIENVAPWRKPGAVPPPNVWEPRATEAGVPLETFHEIARSLNQRGVIGRFSTFLEHVKPLATGERVTKFNALFHWAVPAGREIETGQQVGRFHIMTHAYWREGGPEFNNVNIMGVAHGTDKAVVLSHKAAIDAHLASIGIPVAYTNVFWGGRSEIKPSEISPIAYVEWCQNNAIDPATMRE
jgi:DNA-binding Lrp family transcriptional regulator